MKPLALISLHDTEGVERAAASLLEAGYELLASAESAAPLAGAGLPVTALADYTDVREDYGFPPTLHPRVEHALTASPEQRIELVYVNPYPAAVGNDVGGRALLMLAVKGGRVAVSNGADMERVLAALRTHGRVPDTLRAELAERACLAVAHHFAAEAGEHVVEIGARARALAEGENPYQRPAHHWASDDEDPLALHRFERLSGQAPCFTNLADADANLHTLCLLAEACRRNLDAVPFICIAAKHGNACGAAAGDDPSEVIDKALWAHPQAIWGGELITNFAIDSELARRLHGSARREAQLGARHWMLDLVMAPGFDADAIEVLGKRQMRKLLANPALSEPRLPAAARATRGVRGGLLTQPPPDYALDLASCGLAPESLARDECLSLLIAWAVAYSASLGGNELALARDGALLAAGGGPSTVDAAHAAVRRCTDNGHDAHGAVFAADAFFPFEDAPAILVEAGCRLGAAPTGSVNDARVCAFLDAEEVRMAWIPDLYRGFCRH